MAGYNSDTPEAKRPGYDLVIQAEAGLMAINGEEGTAAAEVWRGRGRPDDRHVRRPGRCWRRCSAAARTGRGRQIELALYDCGLTINGYYALDAMLLGHDTQRYGNAHPSIVPYGMFEAADGPLIIGVGNNRQFEAFCRQVIDASRHRRRPPLRHQCGARAATAWSCCPCSRRSSPAFRASSCWTACTPRASPAARWRACTRP